VSKVERKIVLAGMLFGVLGLVLGITGAYYAYSEVELELGCQSIDYLNENYGTFSDDESSNSPIVRCVDDYQKAKERGAFLNNISPVLLLFGVLLFVASNNLKKIIKE